jgi:hypothetical protein
MRWRIEDTSTCVRAATQSLYWCRFLAEDAEIAENGVNSVVCKTLSLLCDLCEREQAGHRSR